MEGLVHKDTGVRETRYVHSLSSRVFLEGKVGAQTTVDQLKKITSLNSGTALGVKAVFYNCYHWLGEPR